MAWTKKGFTAKKKTTLRRTSKAKKNTLATKAYVQSVVRRKPELKCSVIRGDPAPSFNIGVLQYIQPVAAITAGDNYGQRVGNQIFVRYIDIYSRFINVTDDMPAYIRMFAVYDKNYHPSGYGNDMFRSNSNVSNDPVNFASGGKTDQIHFDLDPQRYTLVWDARVKLGGPASDPSRSCERMFKKRIVLNRKFYMTDNDINPATANRPNFLIFWFAEGLNNNPGLTSDLEHSYRCATYFTDS